jgi:hypothetical protein
VERFVLILLSVQWITPPLSDCIVARAMDIPFRLNPLSLSATPASLPPMR